MKWGDKEALNLSRNCIEIRNAACLYTGFKICMYLCAMIMHSTDTIAAIATPSGAGAIGVIRLSGPDAFSILSQAWKGKSLKEAAPNSLLYGHILDEENAILDEVVLSIFRAPHSYTKEDTIEISCHGSAYILQQLMRRLLRLGARQAEAGEFTQRAFLNGRFDLAQAEAVADIIASASGRSHRIAMAQLRGGVSKDIAQLREELVHFASLIELELDFGEEDVEFASRDDLKNLIEKIKLHIQKLIASFAYGNAIKKGVPVAIVGKPNAGKSTLLNALLNEEKAIVSDIAGTTRDVVEDVLQIEGIHFRLMDTAGLRETSDVVEAIGVERTLERMRLSSIILYLFDLQSENENEVKQTLAEYKESYKDATVIPVANKADMGLANMDIEGIVYISAKNKEGIGELSRLMVEASGAHRFNDEDVIISNIRHVAALESAHEFLDKALLGVEGGLSGDFVAMDIRSALRYLGEITGHVDVEELLGNIFSKFCIGK